MSLGNSKTSKKTQFWGWKTTTYFMCHLKFGIICTFWIAKLPITNSLENWFTVSFQNLCSFVNWNIIYDISNKETKNARTWSGGKTNTDHIISNLICKIWISRVILLHVICLILQIILRNHFYKRFFLFFLDH